MNALAEVAMFVVLLFAAALGGYAWHGDRDQAAISAAQANQAVCESAATANAGNFADVKRQLADLRQRHDDALAAATRELDARDARIAALQATATTRSTAIRKTAHADADCAPLDRLPVCARIADQLWPPEATAGAGNRDAH